MSEYADKVAHVPGYDPESKPVAADIFHAGDDVNDPNPTKLEQQGHETIMHHKHRAHEEGLTDAQILKEEGADLPHSTKAGHVNLPGARP